jgi:hypothetical protein
VGRADLRFSSLSCSADAFIAALSWTYEQKRAPNRLGDTSRTRIL